MKEWQWQRRRQQHTTSNWIKHMRLQAHWSSARRTLQITILSVLIFTISIFNCATQCWCFSCCCFFASFVFIIKLRVDLCNFISCSGWWINEWMNEWLIQLINCALAMRIDRSVNWAIDVRLLAFCTFPTRFICSAVCLFSYCCCYGSVWLVSDLIWCDVNTKPPFATVTAFTTARAPWYARKCMHQSEAKQTIYDQNRFELLIQDRFDFQKKQQQPKKRVAQINASRRNASTIGCTHSTHFSPKIMCSRNVE